jgi:hypothetical protein
LGQAAKAEKTEGCHRESNEAFLVLFNNLHSPQFIYVNIERERAKGKGPLGERGLTELEHTRMYTDRGNRFAS